MGQSGVLGLLDQADPTVDGRYAKRAGVGDPANVLDDLGRELPCRRQNKRRRARIFRPDPFDQRDTEGERLARPGGGLGDHVASGDGVADHVALDREWLSYPQPGERADHGV